MPTISNETTNPALGGSLRREGKKKMRIHRLIIVAVIIATQLVANLAQAEDASETIKLLLKRIEELEKKVERLENKPPFDQGGAGDKVKIGALDEKVKILDLSL